MLDQNTDRMWFVIGALVVGAGIILLANKALPEVFANVTKSFDEVTNNAIKGMDNIKVQSEDIVWVTKGSLITSIGGYKGATVTKQYNQTVDSMNTNKAMRVQISGGSLTIKGVAAILPIEDQIHGREYIYEITAKNNGDKPIQIANNKATPQTLNVGETKRLRFSGTGNDRTHLQFQLNTKDVADNIDVYLYDYQFGYVKDDLG